MEVTAGWQSELSACECQRKERGYSNVEDARECEGRRSRRRRRLGHAARRRSEPERTAWKQLTPRAPRWPPRSTIYQTRCKIPRRSCLEPTVENHNIPYTLADNPEQYLRVYLTGPNSTLKWMMMTPSLPTVDDLPWGTEQKNPPVTVTGGPLEDWSTKGTALIERKSERYRCTHSGLPCDTSRASRGGPLKTHRLLVKLTVNESGIIVRALRTLGFSFPALLDAAPPFAVLEQNPVPAYKVPFAYVQGASPYVALTLALAHSLANRIPTSPYIHSAMYGRACGMRPNIGLPSRWAKPEGTRGWGRLGGDQGGRNAPCGEDGHTWSMQGRLAVLVQISSLPGD
ncbi:hypothetical protein GSI_07490 [Ganoderma sinense ZZ0214-1]|uniref:Uncharacterized protein n=1 Tax=Ganoderma sinense ZZ0214-1 TaxID=1077348 RepID=A0A2G8S957_9APHY|nr:hypothetical protein GSI_07490 [Ganoderma sinense ZZ0214-1]